MSQHYQHIKNVYVAKATTGTNKEHCTLVIETDLKLAHAAHDERMDVLLMDVHKLKSRCPAMFGAVDSVEIRERRPEHIRSSTAGGQFLYLSQPASNDLHMRSEERLALMQ